MKRRDLFAGVAFVATGARAQPGTESLYIPKPHRVTDRGLLHDFMDAYAFVELVTSTPSLRITHIPVLLDRSAGTYGTLYGHVSRNNPQSQLFDDRHSAVIVFRGPHAYISPSWYTQKQAVPTWNFAVVHASGRPKAIADQKVLHDVLAKLIQKFEHRYGEGTYEFDKLPDSYTYGLMGGIVGFAMQIDSLEGKFKLGQERSEEDKANVLRHLDSATKDASMREFTANFYQRLKKAKNE